MQTLGQRFESCKKPEFCQDFLWQKQVAAVYKCSQGPSSFFKILHPVVVMNYYLSVITEILILAGALFSEPYVYIN